ncbi:trypsin-like peptidase domain-containing protein [Streptomyces sp. URMC 129]|uniref:trypsin-like peptidase domain-containing protein n=1 Tax=Streptomyces sp. URMC 129 TaxID=3423407 RepID=UPI003F19F99B
MGAEAAGDWLVRIRRVSRGPVLGAGVLLDTEHVLTCAHVLPGAEVPVAVEPARAGPVGARVAVDGWVPERDDGAWGPVGDLALLRLDRPQPAEHCARLHRLSPSLRRPVRMYGFPHGADQGIVLFGRLDDRIADGRVQISADPGSAAVVPGFSGGGVVDERTGHVIGIVVSAYQRGRISLSFMIPTETVVQHLPQVRQWSVGPSAVDLSLVPRSDEPSEDVEDAEFATWLAGWLGGGASAAPVASVLVAPGDRARAPALWRAMSLADRELSATDRAERRASAPPGAVPPVGSLDLALDVTGQSPEQVAERVCRRMGIGAAAGRTFTARLRSARLPLTVVVDGIDRAPDPDGLMDVLGAVAEQGGRVLLIFHEAGDAVRDAATAALTFRSRRGAVDRELRECAETGRRELDARRRVVRANAEPARSAVDRARSVLVRIPAQRRRLALLDAHGAIGPDRPDQALAESARLAAAARERVAEAVARLDTLIGHRDELRGRLLATALLAGDLDSGTAADVALADLYRTARFLLSRGPCDVPAADAAVTRFMDAVRGRLNGRAHGAGADSGG